MTSQIHLGGGVRKQNVALYISALSNVLKRFIKM